MAYDAPAGGVLSDLWSEYYEIVEYDIGPGLLERPCQDSDIAMLECRIMHVSQLKTVCERGQLIAFAIEA